MIVVAVLLSVATLVIVFHRIETLYIIGRALWTFGDFVTEKQAWNKIRNMFQRVHD